MPDQKWRHSSSDTLAPAPAGYPIKVVRDNTAAIINSTGEPGDLWYGEATGDVSRWLRLKLAEEVGEYLVDGGVGELRDVLAVVEGLCQQAHGIALEGLIDFLRADPRGGFRDAVMMYGHHPEFDGSEAAMGRADNGQSEGERNPHGRVEKDRLT